MDEEALKRNTDCVYFLASPLTCKKGINCEFRHSEAARLLPRDCWYWLGGNCLNAKCSFRHPPLDGRRTSVSASAPASLVPSKATPAPSASMISSSVPANKFKTPCFFFSQGYCSKGNRCAFSHGSLSSTNAQPAVRPRHLEISTGKGPGTNDKPKNQVEVNGPSIQTFTSKSGAGTSTVRTLPSHVYVRAQKTPLIDDDTPPPESSRKALISSCPNVETPDAKIDLHDRGRSVYHGLHTPSTNLNMSNLAYLHDKGVYKKPWEEQPKSTDEQLIKEVRSAEARQLSQGERFCKGSWRERLLKDICPGFAEDESGNTFYREGSRYLPHVMAGTLSPRRRECYEDAHEFGQARSELNCVTLPLDVDSDDWNEHLYGRQKFSNLKRRHISPQYLERNGRFKIKDLRDHLGKRRISQQDQFSGVDAHIGAFEEHAYPERDWVDSMESALSESEQETSWRKFKRAVRRRIQLPDYDYGWDAEGENAEIYSATLPPMHLTGYCPRSKPYCSGGGWYSPRRARCFEEMDQHRSLQARLGSRLNVDEGEMDSGSCFSYVARPSIRSRILSAGSDDGQVVEVLDEFEGPKPLNVLLQEKRKVK